MTNGDVCHFTELTIGQLSAFFKCIYFFKLGAWMESIEYFPLDIQTNFIHHVTQNVTKCHCTGEYEKPVRLVNSNTKQPTLQQASNDLFFSLLLQK